MLLHEIVIMLQESDGDTTLIRIETPHGRIDLLGDVTFSGSTLRVERAHVDGPGAGRLGRALLNRIAAKLLVEADVREIIIQGGTRTTGRNPGRPPKTIRYPHPAPADSGRGAASTRRAGDDAE